MASIERGEVDRFLDSTARVLRRASFSGRRGVGILATPPEGKYPLAYTRDLAATTSVLCDLGALETAQLCAQFLLNVQEPGGTWAECYDADGLPANGERHEDATALAVWAMLTFARASGDERFTDHAREAVERATQFTIERTLNPYLYLVETTASLHEASVSQGYELWNNCAYAAAFALAHRVYGGERYRRLALLIRRAIGLLMTQDSRFLRRLDPNGYPDPRPDVTLMAPYSFGLWAPTERTAMNSAELIERTLWNVEIGGYIRYLPYSAVERSVLPGPWPRYTAWMAQYHYDLGNKDRAEVILRWLFDNLQEGALPEVLIPAASAHRFLGEHRRAIRELRSTRPNGSNGVDELIRERVLADIEEIERVAVEREVIPSGAPHVWTHMETLRALKRGGYIERWEVQPVAKRKR
ncbi:MAG: hypothetical protein HY690_09555 [Chloroflexi bacterium]|nr:hypothetical protein [Chloroflexota bacterium]